MIRLSIVEGAEDESQEFVEDCVTVGRSSDNIWCIKEPSLSRKHFEIAFLSGRYLLINHAKTNGTLVNGQPVGEAFLKPGDEILAGRIKLKFEGGEEKVGRRTRHVKALQRRKRN